MRWSPAAITTQESTGGAASTASTAAWMERAAGETDGDHPLAAEQRHGVGLVGEAAGIVGNRRRVEPDMGEGIVAFAEHGGGETLGALGDQPVVIAIDQDDANGRIGPRQKAVGVGCLDLNHAPLDLPLAAADARWMRMSSATRAAARFSASSLARLLA